MKNSVITLKAHKKSNNVDGQKIVDTEIFCVGARGLQASDTEGVPTTSDMLTTELSPVATSMFDDDEQMLSTAKSMLKEEMAVKQVEA